ncbi:MAG: hypothetical protein MJZ70_02470 [Bacteroidales bacterium]|nr:hypothetical protein [Bacteroidales bacterium]
MYNIELSNLTLAEAQNRILGAVENICDTYHLDEQFGTISYGMHELVSLLERCSDSQEKEFTVNFYIEQDRLSVQVLNADHLNEVYQQLEKATLNDADTTAFTVNALTDSYELKDNGNELWLDIMAAPTFDTINRAEILKKETIRNKTMAN